MSTNWSMPGLSSSKSMGDENIDAPALHLLIAGELRERGYPVHTKTMAMSRTRTNQSQIFLERNVGVPPNNRRIWVHFYDDDLRFQVKVSGEQGYLEYDIREPDSLDRFFSDFQRLWDTISIQSWTKT